MFAAVENNVQAFTLGEENPGHFIHLKMPIAVPTGDTPLEFQTTKYRALVTEIE
jgi:hypothetical protein